MTYSIIGAGSVGSAVAHYFARVDIPVRIATSRGPHWLAATRSPYVTPVSIGDAIGAATSRWRSVLRLPQLHLGPRASRSLLPRNSNEGHMT
ncbi:NAD(P)-binding domain-containing protein [Simplicispira hankyongi]|uniref:Pyrroline-5-carboxylate reductase catalytic N-terminal domain-containing protein n=1 Tax=Simplicispira hankyongi TaxID=2315688 RepID=A0A398CD63_9BURK|nr:NAD(P)-binding domain-containing protein [Simplicispira hankyongi]RID98867.1 hypothetical protein D3F03_06595 [Simplicispira hankyongi]